MLDLRFRSARLFESIQSAAEAPHTVELVARDVRQRVQVFSVLTLLGWAGLLAAVWTSRPSGQAILGISVRALAVGGALISLLLLVFSILQVRRLPADPSHSGTYPRRGR